MAVAELKVKGNDHLKAGRLESACDCYRRALEACEEPAEAAALHCNRALAELKLGQHKQCISDCDAAIARQPRYGKAFYRRAQAREALEQLPEAFKDLHELLCVSHNLVLYLAHETHTRVGRSPPVQYEHEVVTGDGEVDTTDRPLRDHCER